MHGRVTGRKPLLCRCHKATRLQYSTKQHRDKPQNIWNKLFEVMRPTLNFLATTMSTTFGEESTRPMMKCQHSYCETQRWITDVFGKCELQKVVPYTWSKLMAKMQHVIRKYWRKICSHQPWSCTWEVRGRSSINWLLQKKREGSEVAISVSWPQYHWATLGRCQTCSSCKTA